MTALTLDTGALIALERRDARALRIVGAAQGSGHTITVPAPVLAQWWRGQRGPTARLLDAFDVEPIGKALARTAGEALARMRGRAPSVVDAIVMASAASRGDCVLTGDSIDLERLRSVFPAVRLIAV